MAVTVEQIAKAAGVSRGTVDRVLHKRGRVNEEVAARIEGIAQELGYAPKRRARRGHAQPIKMGVVIQLAKASFTLEIKRGIRQAALELEPRGVQILTREIQSVNEEEQLRAIDELVNEGIEGLAIMPADCASVRGKIRALVEEKGVPVITFNSDIVGAGRSCFVGLDNWRSGAAAAGLMGVLIGGAGKVLVVTGYFSNNVNSLRVDGFMDEARRAFPAMEIVGVQSSFDDAAEVEKIIGNALAAHPDLTGILMVSGGHAGVSAALAKLGPTKKPGIIAYDLTPSTRKLLLDGSVMFLIDQEGYVQGYRPLCLLADLLQFGRSPEREFFYTDINIKTRYNV